MKLTDHSIILLLSNLYLTPVLAEDNIGRLFFSERERTEIQKLRFNTQQDNTQNKPKLLLPEQITVNGLVIRSQGKNTAWINGEKDLHKTGLPGLRIDIDNLNQRETDIPITIINGEKQAYVSPGQHMDTATGERLETYENRSRLLELNKNKVSTIPTEYSKTKVAEMLLKKITH
jgi:hypothetical protein